MPPHPSVIATVQAAVQTSHPWDVDTALRRPGRFDRVMLVLPPDEPARMAVLRYHMRERPADGVDFRWLAAKTADYSGADLSHLCETATDYATEEAMTTGRPRPVSTADFRQAIKEVRPSTRPWFELARNEGRMYDDFLECLKDRRI
jgi:SpoVK/Ycf46/Vps4 family AAA+-type ATPase